MTKNRHFRQNLHFFYIFFAKNFGISKKCCNFAPNLKSGLPKNRAKLQKILEKPKKINNYSKLYIFMLHKIFIQYRPATMIVCAITVTFLMTGLLCGGLDRSSALYIILAITMCVFAAVGVVCFILESEEKWS